MHNILKKIINEISEKELSEGLCHKEFLPATGKVKKD